MAIYTILFGLSIFMIALVMAIIKKMFLNWKQEHRIESMMVNTGVDRPAVSVMISREKCVIERREYADKISIFDLIEKSEISLTKHSFDNENQELVPEVVNTTDNTITTDNADIKPIK